MKSYFFCLMAIFSCIACGAKKSPIKSAATNILVDDDDDDDSDMEFGEILPDESNGDNGNPLPPGQDAPYIVPDAPSQEALPEDAQDSEFENND